MAYIPSVPASGGRFQPSKPVVTHTATGVFTISQYVANSAIVNYSISSVPAGFTNNNGAVTLTNVNSIGSVSSAAKKTGPSSATATFERKAYSYYQGATGTYSYSCNCSPNQNATANYAPCPDNSCGSAPCPCPKDGPQNRCICWAYGPPYCQTCYGTNYGPVLDTTPSSNGYVNEFSEWVKLG